ncbi:MAG: hypothetical protein ACLT2T_17225 [Bilophila wadsworthia]
MRGSHFLQKDFACSTSGCGRKSQDICQSAQCWPAHTPAGYLVTASRPLRFLAYGLGMSGPVGCSRSTYEEVMGRLRDFGFETPGGRLCRGSEEVEAYYASLSEKRESLGTRSTAWS